MARINIEDSLLKDDKFIELCIKLGSRIYALGVVTESFILAQKFYLKEENDRLIPFDEWSRKTELHVLLEIGMAEKFENGVYIKGSKESFSWIIQKQNAGKSKSVKKLKQLENARKNKNKANDVERTLNEACTDVNGSEALTPTLTPTLSPTLSHKEKNILKKEKEPVDDFFRIINPVEQQNITLTRASDFKLIEEFLENPNCFGENAPATYKKTKQKLISTLLSIYEDPELFRSDLNAIVNEPETEKRTGPSRADYIAIRIKNKARDLYNAAL